MSRIGRLPVKIPKGVKVSLSEGKVLLESPKGKFTQEYPSDVTVKVEGESLVVTRADDSITSKSRHGLYRNLLKNSLIGLSDGFARVLIITGVGYKTQIQGRTMNFNVGYINPVVYQVPVGVDVKVDKQTLINVKGVDKRLVGQVAANLRAIKPPDVYKQKGVRYAGEKLRKKEGKTGK